MRVAPALSLSAEERQRLRDLLKDASAPANVKQRAEIVLLADEGLEDIAIAERMGIVRQTAAKWRQRYLTEGVPGLEKVIVSPGRRRKYDAKLRREIIRRLEERAAKGMKLGIEETGKALGVSTSSVWALWKEHLQSQQASKSLSAA